MVRCGISPLGKTLRYKAVVKKLSIRLGGGWGVRGSPVYWSFRNVLFGLTKIVSKLAQALNITNAYF